MTIRDWAIHHNRGRPHSALGPGLPEPISDQVPSNEHRHSLPIGYQVVKRSVLGGIMNMGSRRRLRSDGSFFADYSGEDDQSNDHPRQYSLRTNKMKPLCPPKPKFPNRGAIQRVIARLAPAATNSALARCGPQVFIPSCRLGTWNFTEKKPGDPEVRRLDSAHLLRQSYARVRLGCPVCLLGPQTPCYWRRLAKAHATPAWALRQALSGVGLLGPSGHTGHGNWLPARLSDGIPDCLRYCHSCNNHLWCLLGGVHNCYDFR